MAYRDITEDNIGLRKSYWHVSTLCSATAEAFNHMSVTAGAAVLSQARPCGICGEQIATGALSFPIQYFVFPFTHATDVT
jgi:hypothetical protein